MKAVLFVLLVNSLIAACIPFGKDKGTITVTNKTGEPIYNIYFKYQTSKRVDLIGNLPTEASYKYAIKHSDTEDSITINYMDKDKKFHTASVVAYSARYDKERFIFDIK